MHRLTKRLGALALLAALLLTLLSGCGSGEAAAGTGLPGEPERSMELQFATQFSVDYYDGGYKLITLSDGSRFLTVPEGEKAPEGLASDIVPLYQPLQNLYLAATASMCLFDALDRLDAIRLSGTKADGWYIENARTAMEDGRILYAGKYSQPDYELMLQEQCPLAIESLMIGHASDVKDKLEELGIPVFMDQSSLESHPLGRTEWIRLYGALLNEEDRADEIFREQVSYLEEVEQETAAVTEDAQGSGTVMEDAAGIRPTAAFFYINSSGSVVARKSGDYVSRMLELAGADYVFSDLGDPETRTSTVNLEMETFFATAKDADYIIYNSTIGGEIHTLDELLAKNELLAQFRAVQNGNVWCTAENMYQDTTGLGQMIRSFRTIFSGQAEDRTELPYLYRLQ